MAEAKQRGYLGEIGFVSWVTNKTYVERGIVDKSPELAVDDVKRRLSSLVGEGPKILGGWVEEVNPDGSTVSAVRADIERL